MSSPLLTVSEIHTYYGDSYVLQHSDITNQAHDQIARLCFSVKREREILDVAVELAANF